MNAKTVGAASGGPGIRYPRVAAYAFTALAALAAIAIVLAPPAGLPAPGAAGLAILSLGLWATGTLPEYATSLLFFLLAMLFGIAPADVVFSGFESAAIWLVFGGLILGVAVRHTGLGERIANRVADALHGSYWRIVGGIVALGVGLAFLIPSSMGRVVLLTPIAVAMAERFGFAEQSRGRTGVILAAVFGANVPAFSILPANVPNIVLMGASERLWGFTPAYGQYLLLHFPVLGLLKAAGLVSLIVFLFRDRPSETPTESRRTGAPSTAEKTLTGVLLLALAFWATDALHGISPAWVALAAGLACLLTGLAPPDTVNARLNYGSIFFVAGILGLGALLAHAGLGAYLARHLLAAMELHPGHPAVNFAALCVLAVVTSLFTTAVGVPAVLTPLAGEIAEASGLPLRTVVMTQVIGFSTMILPYQIAPLVVGTRIAGLPMGPAIRLCLALSLFSIVLLLPLDFFWWRLLGWL